MLRQYRRRFIILNMCIVGSILLLVFVCLGVCMYHDYYDALENTLTEVVKPISMLSDRADDLLVGETDSDMAGADDEKPKPETETPPDVADIDSRPGRSNPPDMREKSGITTSELSAEERKGITTAFYDVEDEKMTVLSRNPVFSDDVLIQVIPVILAQEESFGTLRAYGMIYYYSGGEGGSYKIAVTRTWYIWESMLEFMLMLIVVFLLVMLIFYFISRRLAGFAAQPVEASNAREKRFIADVSHDLKTPLTVILANSSILQSNASSTVEEQMKWVESTQQATRDMQGIVEELLTISSVESLETALQMTSVDFSAAAERCALQMESVAYERGVVLDTQIEEELWVQANQDYLQRVIGSLMENALKHEPDGGSISAQLAAEAGHVVFTVSNPHGFIAPEDMPHIFERFYRADKTRTGEGHGLGLAIAKSMTEAMGGTLLVHSSEETGTSFVLRLKRVR
ncbi:MAG: HAMP domain-containing histidine kinase [Lachnospiraceae bacterium]|nr:HAMP domain-containing histidine kinase [Lachnospiraceae bacterium]